MPYYMFQTSYTPAAMSAIMQSEQDRSQLIRSVVSKLGGLLEGIWFAFGDYDIVAICQMPDSQSMAAFAMAVAAGGAVKSVKTTPLLTWEEGQNAMRSAAASGYRPPNQPGSAK